MKYSNLGRTGLKVSRLCLGTMNFGSYTDEKDSYEIMDKALELGLNFFDTHLNISFVISAAFFRSFISRALFICAIPLTLGCLYQAIR